jgi:hypothetical protein
VSFRFRFNCVEIFQLLTPPHHQLPLSTQLSNGFNTHSTHVSTTIVNGLRKGGSWALSLGLFSKKKTWANSNYIFLNISNFQLIVFYISSNKYVCFKCF